MTFPIFCYYSDFLSIRQSLPLIKLWETIGVRLTKSVGNKQLCAPRITIQSLNNNVIALSDNFSSDLKKFHDKNILETKESIQCSRCLLITIFWVLKKSIFQRLSIWLRRNFVSLETCLWIRWSRDRVQFRTWFFFLCNFSQI